MNSIITDRFINCHNKLREDGKIRSSRMFALTLDYLPQSLSEILKGRRDVTIELLRKAVEEYNFNPVYLFTGEGTMFITGDENKSFRVLTVVTDRDDDERIVHVPVPAQAGYAGEQLDPIFMEELPTYTLPDYKYKTGTHRSFDVSGDSMEPTLKEHFHVVAERVDNDYWSSTAQFYIHVVVTHDRIMVKRLFRKDDNNTFVLISDNEEFYPQFTLRKSEIKELWLVKRKIDWEMPPPKRFEIKV